MKRVQAILVIAAGISLAGCVLRGKQQRAKATPVIPAPVAEAAPPPPPAKLSVPQTNVELPPPQPVNLEGLTQAPAPEEAPAAPAATPRRTPRPAVAAPKPAEQASQTAPANANPSPAAPAAPAAGTPAEGDRPPLVELVPPEDQKRFQEQVATNTREIQQRLEQIQTRQLNRTERVLVNRIQSFLKQSEAAAGRGDWRGASELAERGLALAKDLNGGK